MKLFPPPWLLSTFSLRETLFFLWQQVKKFLSSQPVLQVKPSSSDRTKFVQMRKRQE
uniref:Uncharacterized protein n=1 Tax=Anguilla anguilla TaxID=7936 RepID=A0A0E9RAP8_ANGAN